MLRHLPFKKNPDTQHCIHIAMDSVTKHFLKETYSPNYLDAIMNPEPKHWVWPFQAAETLDDLGLCVRVFSPYNLKIFSSPELMNGVIPETYIKRTNHQGLRKSLDLIIARNLIEKKSLTIPDLESFLQKGFIPIIMLSSKNSLGKYAVLTGYNDKNFFYHDSGPENAMPNKEISKNEFMNKWRESPSNNTALVIFGRKSGTTYSRFNF